MAIKHNFEDAPLFMHNLLIFHQKSRETRRGWCQLYNYIKEIDRISQSKYVDG